MHLADYIPEQSPLNDPPSIVGGIVARTRDKVCIYAAGWGKDQAPLDDDEWEVWALNLVVPFDSARRMRADLWFDIHQRVAQTPDDLRWIAKCPVPIVVPKDLADASERAVVIDTEAILARFPTAPYACTFAYQMAMAIMAGFETIGLYGVELAYGDERESTVEWACVNWWIGHAEALGIKILRPEQSRLGQHPHLYGIEYLAEKDDTAHYVQMRHQARRSIDG